MNEPSLVVAVIVALPSARAVTTPFDTDAMVGAELDQPTDLLVALDGLTVAVTVPVLPTSNDSREGSQVAIFTRLTPRTAPSGIP